MLLINWFSPQCSIPLREFSMICMVIEFVCCFMDWNPERDWIFFLKRSITKFENMAKMCASLIVLSETKILN